MPPITAILDIPARIRQAAVEVRNQGFREIYSNTAPRRFSPTGRCISCGNPSASGSAGSNYIPNWLALVNDGKLFEAAELSHQTILPEMCAESAPGQAVRGGVHAE